MLRNPRSIALTLLASLVGSIAALAATRAAPAPAEAAADAGCLAKPNATAAPGNHWYYRVERSSGRHCWYQHTMSGAQSEARQARAPARASARTASALPPDSTASARTPDSTAPAPAPDQPSEARDQAPVAPTMVAPAQPYSWAAAVPAPAPRDEAAVPRSDRLAPAPEPAVVAQAETTVAPARAELPAAPPSRALNVANDERPTAAVDDGGAHIPALLGTGLALVIIVLGSMVARMAAKGLGSGRRRSAQRVAASPVAAPIHRADDAPGLVPLMPREGDLARATRPPRAPIAAPPVRPRDVAPAGSDNARVLEKNVRDLLHRLRGDLASAATPAPQSRSAEDLDQALAMWRGRRQRPVG